MSETGYNSDLEEAVNQTIEPQQNKRQRRKTRRTTTLKNAKFSSSSRGKTHKRNPTIRPEYKDSIYYNTKNFDAITKHILASDLLSTSSKSSNQAETLIDKEFNKVMKEVETGEKHSSKEISISVSKTIINGKEHEEVKITEDNSDSPYIKEYTYINGKKTLSKIKK